MVNMHIAKQVPGTKYAVTPAGRVYTEDGQEYQKLPTVRARPYIVIGGKRVHRMVLEAFVGPCPEGMQCRHLNDVKNDNRLNNLAWGTRKENSADAIRNRLARSRAT